MADSERTLLQILPEMHLIFNEENVQKDLQCIKRVKKICADTKHIVANRESEIKDIVRGALALSQGCCKKLWYSVQCHLQVQDAGKLTILRATAMQSKVESEEKRLENDSSVRLIANFSCTAWTKTF
jgi:hypothetical protein